MYMHSVADASAAFQVSLQQPPTTEEPDKSCFGITHVATSKSADCAIVDLYKTFIQHRAAVMDLGGVNSMNQTEASELLDLGTKVMQLS